MTEALRENGGEQVFDSTVARFRSSIRDHEEDFQKLACYSDHLFERVNTVVGIRKYGNQIGAATVVHPLFEIPIQGSFPVFGKDFDGFLPGGQPVRRSGSNYQSNHQDRK